MLGFWSVGVTLVSLSHFKGWGGDKNGRSLPLDFSYHSAAGQATPGTEGNLEALAVVGSGPGRNRGPDCTVRCLLLAQHVVGAEYLAQGHTTGRPWS